MRGGLYAELIGLWAVVPVALALDPTPRVHVLVVLVAGLGYAVAVAGRARAPAVALGLRGAAGLRASVRDGAPWLGAALVLLPAVVLALHGPDGLGRWPREGWAGLAALLLVYATVSVTAQELLFSSFFFWRYRDLASAGWLDALNVMAFGIAHLVYGSWISVGLSMLGRVVLVRVYRRHGNVGGVWLLHLAFGTLVFAVGLGSYFYRPLAVVTPATGR
jgi:uncharacterized protein